MCNGLAGARQFRRDLSDCSSNSNANGDSLKQAFAKVVLPE